ncbi:MAG TPA: hypothetical protein VF868_01505 [Bacteroidia bacterium]
MSSLEKTYKSFSFFLSQFSNTIISLVKVLLRSRLNIKIPVTNQKTCIILGNGPSFNDSLTKHPAFFQKHSLVCVNAFSLSEEYPRLQPEFYVILDPSFWMETNEFLSKVLSSMAEKTTWPLKLCIPFQASRSPLFDVIRSNRNISIHYFNYTVFKGFASITHWFCRKNLAMLQSQNVLVAAIFLSINIGFREIFIVGADHTWHQSLMVNDQNQLCIKDVHFYDSKEQVIFKPFRVTQNSEQTHRMDEIFAIWAKTFYGYIAVNAYARYRDAAIYNASEISFIDAFKRVKL